MSSTYHMLNTLHVFSHLILVASLEHRCYCEAHFMLSETQMPSDYHTQDLKSM